MYATREWFPYFQCARCHCLQIADIPAKMERYYPLDYIGFNQHNPQHTARLGIPLWANTMDFVLIEDVLHQPPVAPTARRQLAHQLTKRALAHYLPQFKDERQVHILDVGCGSGEFLIDLQQIGFCHLLGVDLYIDQDLIYENGIKVIKGTLEAIHPGWDVIMFHHSFEHMPQPLKTLQTVSRLLSPQGVALIRIPIVPSYVWEIYGPDWVQLDAPRHFFLHSLQSMKILAEQADLRLVKVLYDSNLIQFTGSEQYRRNISYFDERSYSVNPASSIFRPAQLTAFRAKTRMLNETGRGDQAAFYLVKQETARSV